MEYSEQIYLFERENAKNTRKRIGLLGGTFNPVHNGHIYMAQRALEEYALQSVMFIPSGNPPHKADEAVADREHRFAMLELALEGNDGLIGSRIEFNRPGKTYTVDTLRLLHQSIQDAGFYFIIGADTLFELHSWRCFNEVAAMTQFICFLRPETEKSLVEVYISAIREKYANEILVSSYEGLDISSTMVRERIASGRGVKGLIDEKVERYILANGVYG